MRVECWIAMLLSACGALAQDAKAPLTPAPNDPPAPWFIISKETTYVGGPLRKDGTIDYVAAINQRRSQGITPKENAAIPLLAAVSGDAQRAEHYAKVWKALGVAPPADVHGAELPPDNIAGFEESLNAPWTAERFPEVAQALAKEKVSLDLMVEASKRSHYFMPLVREQETDPLVSVLLPHLNPLRHQIKMLKSRAMLRLGSDDTEGFCSDAIAIVRLGRLTTNAPTLIENLVACLCETIGLDAIKIAATGGWLSEAQVEKLLTALRTAPASHSMDEAFDGGERGFLLEFLQVAAVHGTGEAQRMLQPLGIRNGPALPVFDPANKDWNAALRKANGWYDRLAEGGRQPTYAKRMHASAEVMKDLSELKARTDGWRSAFVPIEDRLIAIALPSMERAYTVETRTVVNRELTETALALSAFRSKTGEYPPELKFLVPTYFKAIPADAFTERPLVYRLTGNGYSLMSLGPDGEEGSPAKNDDLIVEVHK